jgi:hypothetical protein
VAGNACLQILVLCYQITYLTKFNNLRKEHFKNYDPLPWQPYLLLGKTEYFALKNALSRTMF